MKRSGSENNLVGKEQNLFPGILTDDKNKVPGSLGLSPHPQHRDISQDQDSIFIPLRFVHNILPPSAYLC